MIFQERNSCNTSASCCWITNITIPLILIELKSVSSGVCWLSEKTIICEVIVCVCVSVTSVAAGVQSVRREVLQICSKHSFWHNWRIHTMSMTRFNTDVWQDTEGQRLNAPWCHNVQRLSSLVVVLQVRDGAMNCLIEIYRHVGERVRMDLGKKGLPQSRCVQVLAVNTHD